MNPIYPNQQADPEYHCSFSLSDDEQPMGNTITKVAIAAMPPASTAHAYASISPSDDGQGLLMEERHVRFNLTDTQEEREEGRYRCPTARTDRTKIKSIPKEVSPSAEPMAIDPTVEDPSPSMKQEACHLSAEDQLKSFLTSYEVRRYPFDLRQKFLEKILAMEKRLSPPKTMQTGDLNFKIEHSLRMAQIRAAKGLLHAAIARLQNLLNTLNETTASFFPYGKVRVEKLLARLQARQEAERVGPAHASYAEWMQKSNATFNELV